MPSVSNLSDKLREVYHNDPTVYRALQAGLAFEDLVVILSKEKKLLLAHIQMLELIRPKKIRLPDGSIKVWTCPDHLIPEETK